VSNVDGIELRTVRPDDWTIWRDLRLAALAEAPYAFGSTLAQWQDQAEERWRARLAIPGSHNVVAVVDGRAVAMASGVPAQQPDSVERPDSVELISMWVSPAVRGRGVGDRLIREVERWAAARGSATVRLSVMPDNGAALALYRRHGFVDTGEPGDPLPDGRGRELVLAKTVRRPFEADGLPGFPPSAQPRSNNRYVVSMFPYPSGDLHMGHAEAYSISDAIARYLRLKGHNVLAAIGWDSFGLPAENAAFKRNLSPRDWTYDNIEVQAEGFRRLGMSFDWRTRLHTSDPEYYRWNQWLYLKLYERGLAYRATDPVNWCPNDRTVLANEQVVQGRCERCGAVVGQRDLTQWFFRITRYAQRLLDDMDQLGGWPEDVLTMQRNWIGRSAGAYVDFPIEGTGQTVRVFTTRPETLYGATFLVVADTELAGRAAVNPVNGERIPVHAADHVVSDYGTGASIDTGGRPVDCGPLTGRTVAQARDAVVRDLERTGSGTAAVIYRLRDWLISRQRYWGTPIPMVHCPACGVVPVPEDQLPVTLPETGFELRPGSGEPPLATAGDWVSVPCPRCGGPARRDVDTMDTFVDSSWYFLRYPDPAYDRGPFNPEGIARWLPVDDYIGGKEHAILHLLYARFITKVLHDLGMLPFDEPFRRLTNQGQVIMAGKSMSKSLGNLVNLQDQIARFGPDAVRVTMLFAGPPEDDIDWATVSPAGAVKWLARVRRLAGEVGLARPDGAGPDGAGVGSVAARSAVHRLVDGIDRLMDQRRFNVAIARMMELTTLLRRELDHAGGVADRVVREGVEALCRMLSCVAPFSAEDAWAALGNEQSVVEAGWPEVDPALLAVAEVTCVVQVDGKVRARLAVPVDIGAEELRSRALAADRIVDELNGRPPRRVVVRPPTLVNVIR